MHAGLGEIRFLEVAPVVVRKAVDADDPLAVGQQPVDDVRADEPGGAGDDHVRHGRSGGSLTDSRARSLSAETPVGSTLLVMTLVWECPDQIRDVRDLERSVTLGLRAPGGAA